MNINRNNYEEYFLLYADNELTAAEKNRVDLFLQENPDLQEELQMLLQTVLTPEDWAFDNKDDLKKHTAFDEAIQHRLILMLDKELPATEVKDLEKLLLSKNELAAEWSILQQTQLSPADAIVFPGKAQLYKKENSRVVPFAWWRMTAAAVLIGFGVWGAIRYNNGIQENIVNAGETKGQSSTAFNPIPDTATGNAAPVKIPATNEAAATVARQIQPNEATSANNTEKTKKAVPLPAVTAGTITKTEPGQSGLVAGTALENINNKQGNNNSTVIVSPERNAVKEEVNTLVEETQVNETYAVNTFSETNKVTFASFDEEDATEETRKTKVGGFFKKVKRLLERKANIKTGKSNNIKIANMSFAMH